MNNFNIDPGLANELDRTAEMARADQSVSRPSEPTTNSLPAPSGPATSSILQRQLDGLMAVFGLLLWAVR